MQTKKQPKWKRLLPSVIWSVVGIGLFVLLISASGKNEGETCKGLEITIDGYKHEMFISEADIKSLLEENLNRRVKGCKVGKMNLRMLESGLQKDNWVSKAQLFIDNKKVLHVNISERLPVARIFTVSNKSYYIDSDAVILPLSQQQIADVPVFTNMPERANKLVGPDSLFWRQLGKMGNYIISDSFLLMQIGQVVASPDRQLQIYPVVGNHVVLVGQPSNFHKKLNRLKKFDQQVLAKAGLNKYSRLDLRFDKQVIATLRGKEEVTLPQINISPNPETALAETESTKPQEVEVAETNSTPKPQAEAKPKEVMAAVVEKPKPKEKPVDKKPVKPKQETARNTNRKEDKKPGKNVAVSQKKPAVKQAEKIVASSNNKPTKKALEQLPKKTEKPGLIEVDLRQRAKTDQKTNSQPKALMPKKN